MTTDPSSSPPAPAGKQPPPAADTATAPPSRSPRLTRASAAWAATAAALLLLVMLIILILQNPTRVEVTYLWFAGSLPLGTALLIAAVTGGVLVGIAGVTRVTQLRLNARRTRQPRRTRQHSPGA